MTTVVDAAVLTGPQLINELVAIRKASGLRQVDVAARMGIGQPSVSELERGEVPPKLSTLERYAAAVGATIKHLVIVDGGEADGSGSTEAGT